MTRDRLAQIIQTSDVLHLISNEDRQYIKTVCTTMAAARAMAFELLPEPARIALVQRSGLAPDVCGPAIPVSPARGPVRVFDIMQSYPKGQDETVLKPAGYLGRKSMQRLDVFGRMAAQSARKGGDAMLSDSQISIGRLYRTLVEDREAGAVRCASLEAGRGGGGGTREGFTDHRLDMSQRIDRLQARIGSGCSMAIRRIRPSKRGGIARSNISDRTLVDSVCLYDLDLSAVLRGSGWAVYGDTVTAACSALAGALDRMIGPIKRIKVQGVTYGASAVWSFED
jgi:hypothetical protein